MSAAARGTARAFATHLLGGVNPFPSPAVLVLVCNKADLAARRVVSGDRCASLARGAGALCVETSAKTNVGVHSAFHDVAEAMLERFGGSGEEEQAEAGQPPPLLLTPLHSSPLLTPLLSRAARRPRLPSLTAPRRWWPCC